jgi:hypothetical protein
MGRMTTKVKTEALWVQSLTYVKDQKVRVNVARGRPGDDWKFQEFSFDVPRSQAPKLGSDVVLTIEWQAAEGGDA